eukprot:m.11548 g.11548  ORF g.11548 m.11548 type:complete len:423 (+) comp23498_c0_seq1:226-1494(+)
MLSALANPVSGRRVHALRPDGFYHPAIVESVRPGTDPLAYAVSFDDGHCCDVTENHIVGTGFQTLGGADAKLRHGQKVICVVGEREFEADVLEHDATQNTVMVSLGDGTELLVQPKQLRLPVGRRRSSLDDGYTSASSPDLSISGLSPRLEKRLEEARRAKTEQEAESIIDECTAALVLTSLSSSPTSWDSRLSFGRAPESPVWRSKRHPPPASPLATAPGGGVSLKGAWLHDSPSPCPSWASRSTATPPPGDHENDSSAPVSPAPFTARAYSSSSSCPGSPAPIRFSYYPAQTASDSSVIDPAAVLALATMKQQETRSHMKSHPIMIPHTSVRVHPYAERSFTPPRTDMPPLYKVLDFEPGRNMAGMPRGSPARNRQQHGPSPVRKFRSDGRKCRKVYGMENKHLWCTQCRWKKACVRFID